MLSRRKLYDNRKHILRNLPHAQCRSDVPTFDPPCPAQAAGMRKKRRCRCDPRTPGPQSVARRLTTPRRAEMTLPAATKVAAGEAQAAIDVCGAAGACEHAGSTSRGLCGPAPSDASASSPDRPAVSLCALAFHGRVGGAPAGSMEAGGEAKPKPTACPRLSRPIAAARQPGDPQLEAGRACGRKATASADARAEPE